MIRVYIDKFTMSKGFKLVKGGTPSWATPFGQSTKNNYKPNIGYKPFYDFLEKHNSIDASIVKILENRRVKTDGEILGRSFINFVKFDQVYVNDVKIENSNFAIYTIKESEIKHSGRMQFKYGPLRVEHLEVDNQSVIDIIYKMYGDYSVLCFEIDENIPTKINIITITESDVDFRFKNSDERLFYVYSLGKLIKTYNGKKRKVVDKYSNNIKAILNLFLYCGLSLRATEKEFNIPASGDVVQSMINNLGISTEPYNKGILKRLKLTEEEALKIIEDFIDRRFNIKNGFKSDIGVHNKPRLGIDTIKPWTYKKRNQNEEASRTSNGDLSKEHDQMIKKLSKIFNDRTLFKAKNPEINADFVAINADKVLIFEVKSNISEVTKGFGQLYFYEYKFCNKFETNSDKIRKILLLPEAASEEMRGFLIKNKIYPLTLSDVVDYDFLKLF